MKAIVFVKVDAKDGIPATQHPNRHGPADPLPGITITHWESGNPPRYYGTVEEGAATSVPGVLQEIPPDEWENLTQQRRAKARAAIDTAAGAARTRFVSAGYLIEEEYRQALAAVTEWRANGSPLDSVPQEIQSGADYGDLDAESAAVEIEQNAAALEGVLNEIRSLRLNGKRAVNDATALELRNVEREYIGLLESLSPPEVAVE
jgi:hypothetical protein